MNMDGSKEKIINPDPWEFRPISSDVDPYYVCGSGSTKLDECGSGSRSIKSPN